MTGVQVFLMAFGAVLTLIGVLVFFLLAWFKETTGQHDVVKVLQAEFRLTNPALVIFIGGLGLMVAPIFLMPEPAADPEGPTPPPTLSVQATVTPTSPIAVAPTPTTVLTANVNAVPEPTPVPPSPTPLPTPTPFPAPTATPPPTATPTPVFVALDPTGRWRNQNGYLDFQRLGVDQFAYADFDNFGNQVGQGTATQEEDTLYITGEGLIFTGFGYTYYTYTGDFTVTGDVMQGDLYDSFGNYVGSVSFTRDRRGL